MRIYLGGGLAYFYDKERVENTPQRDVWEKSANWNTGLGVGLEVLQGRRWSWQVEADFAHLGKSGDITIVPQVGVYFYW